MAVLIAAHRTIVTAAPGTGSTSLTAAATKVAGARIVDVDEKGPDSKHGTVSDLIAHGCLPAQHGCRIVTSVRNPFAFWFAEWRRSRTRWSAELVRPSSWVHDQPGLAQQIEAAVKLDFADWIRVVLGSDPPTQHVNPGHVDEADVVLRTESLDRDAAELVGTWFPPVPRLNVTGPADRRYRAHYDAAARALVTRHNQPTLQRFDYRF